MVLLNFVDFELTENVPEDEEQGQERSLLLALLAGQDQAAL